MKHEQHNIQVLARRLDGRLWVHAVVLVLALCGSHCNGTLANLSSIVGTTWALVVFPTAFALAMVPRVSCDDNREIYNGEYEI